MNCLIFYCAVYFCSIFIIKVLLTELNAEFKPVPGTKVYIQKNP